MKFTARLIPSFAVELTKMPKWDAGQWYNLSCICSVASSKVPGRKQEYADRAMDLLRHAVTAGFKDAATLKEDHEFDPLRGRDDFKKLLDEIPISVAPPAKR